MSDQPDMANEELAALFSRNLTFQPQPLPTKEELKPESKPIVYSISQHYHHSSHITQEPVPVFEQQRRSSEPLRTQQSEAELILTNHGVNPGGLSASQTELFKTADDVQKMRLIELWQICPPENAQENPSVAWTSTTMQQEELLAQLRYERKLEEEAQKQNVMSLDGTPLTPVQTGEGQWTSVSYMEPYMLSGYEALARRDYEESVKRQYEEAMVRPKDVYSHFGAAVGGPTYRPATDPVYNNDWMQRQEVMENQYGAFQSGEMEL